MITYKTGNIVDDDAELLVNLVNCVGVMGKGVALAFKNKWPDAMAGYVKDCELGLLKPGGCVLHPLPDKRAWLAFATKDHWRDPSRLEWIESGLRKIATLAAYKSIALPPPGCGNGGLNWLDVKPFVYQYLSNIEDLRIYNVE